MELTIACMTDTHGNLTALGRTAALLGELRRGDGPVVLVDNGDTIQGTPIVHYYSRQPALATDHPVARALELLECDFAVPGNHDFDYGTEVIETIANRSSFPWLASNVVRSSAGPSPFLPYAVKRFGTLKIGFVGATTRTPMWKDPSNVAPYEFVDEVDAVRQAIAQLREHEGVHFTVVCYHGGMESHDDSTAVERRENQARRMITEVGGIDLLVTGHQHRFSVETIGKTLVIQPGWGGRVLGRVTLRFVEDSRAGEWLCSCKEAELLDLASYEPHPRFVASLSAFEEQAKAWLERPLCALGVQRVFSDVFREVCLGEHAWVQWMHDVQKSETGSDISAVAIKNPEFAGTDAPILRIRDVLEFFPYPDNLCVALLSGAQIIAALEVTASFFARGEDGSLVIDTGWREPHVLIYQYLMWDGIEYEIDVDREPGRRIARVTIHGKAVEADGSYRVVMTQYFKNTSSKYALLHDAPVVWKSEREFSDLLIEDASRRQILDVKADQNWSVKR